MKIDDVPTKVIRVVTHCLDFTLDHSYKHVVPPNRDKRAAISDPQARSYFSSVYGVS